jgi:hypothetical protein
MAERVELPLTPGWLSRGFCDEDGDGDRARSTSGGYGGYGVPDSAGDFQWMVSGGDREVDLDVSAGWIVMVLHLDRAASQHGGEAGDARNTRSDVRQLSGGGPVPVTRGELSGSDPTALAAVRDFTAVCGPSWRSVTRRSAVTAARPSRPAAALSSVLLN